MRYAISTFFMPENWPTCSPPRLLRPATPMRTVSLAPSTLPEDLVPATVMVAALASEEARNRRRVRRMGGPPRQRGREGDGRWMKNTRRREAWQTDSRWEANRFFL